MSDAARGFRPVAIVAARPFELAKEAVIINVDDGHNERVLHAELFEPAARIAGVADV